MMAELATVNTAQTLPEKTLISDCLAGERVAQKKLYHLYCKAMYTLAFRITKNHELTNDCLQDAFLEVFVKLHTYKGTGTLGSWIKTIVIRKATKSIVYETRYGRMDELKEEPMVPYQTFSSQILEKAIQDLPSSARTIFTLVEMEGYKHTECAELLQISAGTSRTQLHYAKKILQIVLKNERDEI